MADGCARLSVGAASHFSERDGRHFDLDVDSIEERSGNALAIALDLGGAAAAGPVWVAEISAGTGVEGGDQHEIGGKRHRPCGARDGHGSVLQRLTEDLKRGAFELG